MPRRKLLQMSGGTILDRLHFTPSKRRGSFDLEDFESTAEAQLSQSRYDTRPPTPSPPSKVMPSMVDVENLNIPMGFFGSYDDEPLQDLLQADTDDRLEEVVNEVSAGRNRRSAASTMTVGRSPTNNSRINGESSDDDDTDQEPENKRRPRSTQVKPTPAKKARARSMELIVDSGDEDVEPTRPAFSIQPKKSTPKRARSRSKELIERSREEEEVIVPKKRLRERTVAQEHPYGFDRARHHMSTKKGREVENSEVELEFRLTQRKATKTKKNARTSSKAQAQSKNVRTGRFVSVDTGRSSPSSAAGTPDLSGGIELQEERVLQNTTLNIWMQGDDDGANAIQLAQCPTLTSLFDHIDDTWGKVCGKTATKVKCMLPWMTEKTSLVMYRGWDTSFQKMVRNIHKAPLWRGKGEGELDVELVVTMG